MNTNDFDKFALIWKATNEYYNQPVTDGSLGLSFKNLEKYALVDIEKAINQHIQDTEHGKFSPKVSDIIGNIEKANYDGRLSSDEAWAIALKSFDEYQTVALNEEIATALALSRYIYSDGDRVGARMAFKSAYDKEVEEARAAGRPEKWWPSIGLDPDGRQSGIQFAVDQGYLPKTTMLLINKPYEPDNPLLERPKKSISHE